MIAQLESAILAAAQTVYNDLGWAGVAALLIFENATGITPSEIILGLAGWMLIAEHRLAPGLAFVGGFYAAIGSVVGASITYWAARLGGRPLVDRFARWVRITPKHLAHAEELFQRWGPGLVCVGRVIPGIRTLISIPAGLVRMRFPVFLAATFLGAYIWCTLLISAGYLLGREWAQISLYLNRHFPYLVIAGVVTLLVYFWVTRRK